MSTTQGHLPLPTTSPSSIFWTSVDSGHTDHDQPPKVSTEQWMGAAQRSAAHRVPCSWQTLPCKHACVWTARSAWMPYLSKEYSRTTPPDAARAAFVLSSKSPQSNSHDMTGRLRIRYTLAQHVGGLVDHDPARRVLAMPSTQAETELRVT